MTEPSGRRFAPGSTRGLASDGSRSAWLARADLQLTRYDERGGARRSTTGMEHSPTSATGTGWEPTPWRATQRAAWDDVRPVAPRPYSAPRPDTCKTPRLGTPR
jgi:hypothetical protein